MNEFTDENFEKEVLKSTEPVLVDFFTSWCYPCKMLMPTIEKLAKEYAGKIKVGKINAETCAELSLKYGIKSVPTVILVNNGKEIDRFVGITKEQDFKKAVNYLLCPP